MASFEDHFSEQARVYASYRPSYPGELYDYLASISPGRQLAWDCGTGNGQAALELAKRFDRVIATDGSAEQISLAVPHERIEYRVERAEAFRHEPGSVDTITVATAVHWFDLEPFYQVVRQVARPEGILAVWMYHLPTVAPSIDAILSFYYAQVLAGYWPERFQYMRELYHTLPFPFQELTPPAFNMQTDWDLGQLVGFLDSWSSTRRYQKDRGLNPVSVIWQRLLDAWGESTQVRTLRWPLYLRIGRING